MTTTYTVHPVDESVGQRIRDLRSKKSVTQADLVGLTGIIQSDLSRYESGEYALRVRQLLTICRALDVSIGEFLDGVDFRLVQNGPTRA